jgi:simple sugar transport system permease protein
MSQSVTTQPKKTAISADRDGGSTMKALMQRPEFGAFFAAIIIFIFFFIVAPSFRHLNSGSTVLYASAQIGIVATAVSMLMIGGEFDLSAGVAATSCSLFTSMFCFQLGLNLFLGAFLALLLALLIGFINGFLVVRTGIPSFLVTLGTFFILQGANLGVTKLVTGTVATQDISQMDGFNALSKIFATSFNVGGVTVSILVVYWLVSVAIGTWVLLRTRVGNWIFAVGGNAASARAVGVPVAKVKIGLFMFVGVSAWFYGMHQLFNFNTIQAGQGVGNEFLYIIAAVVGGTLLTGGYGSAIGAAIGAFIFGMTTQGIVYAGWDPNWFKSFLGLMLLLAVAVNLYVKKLATTRK